MATIKQVAALARVSTATVSRVLNNSAYVEPATRERVEKAMRTLNYRRDMAAVALAKRSGNMLGLLTGNLADPFFARLARGVEAISRQHGFRLMVCSGSHQSELEQYGLEFLINQGCEAIVAHTTRLSDEQLLRYASHMPALIPINRYLPELANRSVWLDNIAGTRAAVEHLVAQGHRHIAFIRPAGDYGGDLQSEHGLREALGGTHAPTLQVIVHDGTAANLCALLEKALCSARPPTAYVVARAIHVLTVMMYLTQRGKRIPQDIAVISRDDETFLQHTVPAITRYAANTGQFARSVCKAARQLAEAGTLPPKAIRLMPRMIRGDTL
jgi:LacI family transcriptional regulator